MSLEDDVIELKRSFEQYMSHSSNQMQKLQKKISAVSPNSLANEVAGDRQWKYIRRTIEELNEKFEKQITQMRRRLSKHSFDVAAAAIAAATVRRNLCRDGDGDGDGDGD